MTDCPNMVMVGAAGRNVGKTEFCCGLIRRASADRPVTGIKITPGNNVDEASTVVVHIEQKDFTTEAQRYGGTENLCDSVPSSEAGGERSSKDTDRMLAAGATEVFWLRTSRNNLTESLTKLLAQIPENRCIVCESTSARTVVKPGVFLIIKAENAEAIKPSCKQVMNDADRVITFNGNGWNVEPEQIHFTGGRWHIAETEESDV